MIDTGPIPYRGLQRSGYDDEKLSIIQIVGRYESLLECVCAGAKFGTSVSLELRFTECRNWIRPRIRKLASILEECHTSNPDKVAMLLDRLLEADTLASLLNSDDGSLIQRMTWISQALFDADSND